jgi:hypothetical protein
MKNFKKDKESTKVEKEGIRKAPLENVLTYALEDWKAEKSVLTAEILRRLAAIARPIIERIRSPTG